jgi:hypothetical protein
MVNEANMPIQSWADPSALGNMTIGLLIFCQAFMMFGKVDSLTIISVIPWVLTGFAVLLIVVVIQFRRGDIVNATANGLLGAVLMGQVFVKGIISLVLLSSGQQAPAAMVAGGYTVDAMAFITSGIILIFVGLLVGHATRWGALAVWAAAIGFLCLATSYFGFGSIFGLIGATGLMIVAAWLVYSGVALLVNSAVQKEILPLGKPLFTQKVSMPAGKPINP